MGMMYYIHILRDDTGVLLGKQLLPGVPRVGDELRVGDEGAPLYYTVLRVIWCFNEPCPAGQRINIGVELVEVSESDTG